MKECILLTFSFLFLNISPSLSFPQFILFNDHSPLLSQQECLLLLPVEALIKYKGDFSQSATSMGAVDDFAPDPVLPLPYKEAISQGIGPQV